MIIGTKFEILNIYHIYDGDLESCKRLMPEKRKRQVDRLRFPDDRRRTVAGELLARRMLAERCRIMPESIVFGRTDIGKPFAVGLDVEFNISHSGEYVICAVNDAPIGVDIEKIRPVKDRLIHRVCTDRELDYVLDGEMPLDEKTSRFFQVWTGKEAFFKCIGTGITDLKAVCVLDETIRYGMTYFLWGDYAVSIFRSDKPNAR